MYNQPSKLQIAKAVYIKYPFFLITIHTYLQEKGLAEFYLSILLNCSTQKNFFWLKTTQPTSQILWLLHSLTLITAAQAPFFLVIPLALFIDLLIATG